MKSRLASSGSSSSPPPPMRSGASCRASASAASIDSVSGTPSYTATCDNSCSRPGRTTTDSPPRSSSSSPGTTSTIVTPWSPSCAANAESGGTIAPSSISSTCGWSSSGCPSRLKRVRPSRRGFSRSSSSLRSSLISRREPAPSTAPASCTCGSHFVHSQYEAAPRAATTAITRSSGECSVASWATSERADPCTVSASPDSVMW